MKNKMDDIQKIILDEVRILRTEVNCMQNKFVTKDTYWKVTSLVIAIASFMTALLTKLFGMNSTRSKIEHCFKLVCG